MNNKVLLIIVDGMRPDSIQNIPFAQELIKKSSYTFNANTVFPSVTLPCHMSLFHSVSPQRHGITTNTYIPQVRPINGLCEQLRAAKKTCAFFYNWEELRDLSRPDSLAYSFFASGHIYSFQKANIMVTQKTIEYLNDGLPDFVFLYLGYTDWAGHAYGWMSDEYIQAVRESWDCIEKIMATLPENYTTFITSDHGGHDRSHGTDMKEDMTIPIIIKGSNFAENVELNNVNIIDIAPTIVDLLKAEPAEEWEGCSIL
jgi:predicted AlkP superfamily pyrophosphatase or phosphodiesterase